MIGCLFALCLVVVTPQLPLSIATTDDALAVFANPAGLATGRAGDIYAIYNFRSVEWRDVGRNLTLVGGAGPLAAFIEPGPLRYGFALGAGPREFSLGARLMRDSLTHWDIGAMSRPTRWLSLGLLWHDLQAAGGTWQAGAAVRPLAFVPGATFGSRLTLFGELYLRDPLVGVVGVEAEPVDGISVSARVAPAANLLESNLSAGLVIGLGRAGVGVASARAPSEVALVLRAGAEKRRSLPVPVRRCIDIRLREQVSDQRPGFSLSMRPTRTTWELLEMLDRARRDREVRALVVEFDGVSMGAARAQELRDAIVACRGAGKKVYAWADSYGMHSLYVASACDRVICHVQGDVSIAGVSSTMPFLKGTLEKLGIEPDYTRHGRYKSAVEIFSEDSMSAANREQLEALLDTDYDELLSGIADGRRLGRDSLERLVGWAWFSAAEAHAAGLVDTFGYRDQLDSLLKSELKGLQRTAEADYNGIARYVYDWQPGPAVAVIYATGSIGGGASGTDFLTGDAKMGSETMRKAIARARDDRRVKAIVLRIDSPGGDGFASDVIWRELEKTRTTKPVIVSMGDVAGSGGYYIACNARRVFALPMTLTGSIGVFGLKFVTEGLYNKLGIRRQTVKRGEHADALADLRLYTPEEESLVQAQIDRFYWQFVEKVAQGRGLSRERVDSLGQGRVWSGRDARRIGLVDTLGGLLQAVEFAKQEAGLVECDLVFFPEPKTDVFSRFGGAIRERLLAALYE
jgi:protease-4